MFRSSLLMLAVAACTAGDNVTDDSLVTTDDTHAEISIASFQREHVAGDVYHYKLRVKIGSAPNAAIQVHRFVRERAPFVPRRTSHAVFVNHGDFSNTLTNFAPTLGNPASPATGLAPYLAAHDVDVWGLDRRWTLPTATGDISDLGTMSLAQELDDLRAAVVLARAVRTADGSGSDKLALLGFSHGAQLAYTYAAVDGGKPTSQRTISALVALDFYGAVSPANADVQQSFCDSAAFEYDAVANGQTDVDNSFFIQVGELDHSAPNDESPLFGPPFTNRTAMLSLMGATYQLGVNFAPAYHLLSGILDADGNPTDLRLTKIAASDAWLAGAPPHQSMLESANLDAMLCGDAPPLAAPLSNIRVPLLYVGAAGGIGDLGVYSTTKVSSTDVTTKLVQLFGADQRAADVGHGDLLYGRDAQITTWQPILGWLVAH